MSVSTHVDYQRICVRMGSGPGRALLAAAYVARHIKEGNEATPEFISSALRLVGFSDDLHYLLVDGVKKKAIDLLNGNPDRLNNLLGYLPDGKTSSSSDGWWMRNLRDLWEKILMLFFSVIFLSVVALFACVSESEGLVGALFIAVCVIVPYVCSVLFMVYRKRIRLALIYCAVQLPVLSIRAFRRAFRRIEEITRP